MTAANDLVMKLAGLYAAPERPDADQRTAAFHWGGSDQAVAWALSLANMVSSHPVAKLLYVAHAAEDVSHSPQMKAWAYRVAVDHAVAKGAGQRARAMVEGYNPAWGHQAARDGLAIALWPHLREDVPGIGKRCEAFGCGKQGYQRIRDEVTRQACDMLTGFRLDVQESLDERFSADFRHRWEMATDRAWTN